MAKTIDIYDRKWITENALEEIENYERGVLTLRGLHYRLVSRGMTNTILHYKRVISAMTKARWNGEVDFETFSDNDREVIGFTASDETVYDEKLQQAKDQVEAWMTSYRKNRWENQNLHPEIWIEKKALQGVFQPVCRKNNVALAACKGYPSLTFLNEAAERFRNKDCDVVILYFGDYDPSGEDIPRSLLENLQKMGVWNVRVERILLQEEDVIRMKLPPAPVKKGDTRATNWSGLGQVELDAVEPKTLVSYIQSSIDEHFNSNLHDDLMEQETAERVNFKSEMLTFVQTL